MRRTGNAAVHSVTTVNRADVKTDRGGLAAERVASAAFRDSVAPEARLGTHAKETLLRKAFTNFAYTPRGLFCPFGAIHLVPLNLNETTGVANLPSKGQ